MFPKKEEVQCVDKLSLVGNSPTRCTTVADPGGIPGSHGSPLSAQLSSRTVCTMRTLVLMELPYLINSKFILTLAHLQVFRNEFWSIDFLP